MPEQCCNTQLCVHTETSSSGPYTQRERGAFIQSHLHYSLQSEQLKLKGLAQGPNSTLTTRLRLVSSHIILSALNYTR